MVSSLSAYYKYFDNIKLHAVISLLLIAGAPTADSATSAKESERKSQRWKTISVQAGDTLSDLLHKSGVPTNTIYNILHMPKGKRLTRIVSGAELSLRLQGKDLFELRYHLSPLRYLSFRKTGLNSFASKEVTLKPDVKLARRNIHIEDSLFISGKDAGLSDKLLLQLTSIFDTSIDFVYDIHKDDSFSLVFEEHYLNGKKITTGKILAARFINKGKITDAIRYTDTKGHIGYYSSTGESLQQSFSRTPVDFTRISSGFTNRRLHPIHGITKPHRAIDYAAPMNTPVKVTSDGVVSFVGYQKGYGKVIYVKHKNNITTVYAHLNRYSKNLQRGSHVEKGNIIGFVGMTGYATGPHLHYEFRVNGVHKNPLTVKLPRGKPIPSSELTRFRQKTKPLLAKLKNLSDEAIAMEKSGSKFSPET